MERGAADRRATILNLQILRFIAALGVLLSHAADLTLPRNSPFWSFPWTAGVDVFFVISGIIMTIIADGHFGQRGAARQFLKRRIVRIVPIYWLFTALMIATIALLPAQVRNSQADATSIVTSLLFIPWPRGDGQIVPILAQGWTLNYEIFFYACFGLALLHRRGLALLVAALAVLALLHPLVPRSIVALHFVSNPVILEFVAGIGLARLWLGGARLPRIAAALFAIAAILLFALAGTIGLSQWDRWIANGVPAVLLCGAFLFAPEPATPGPLRRAIASGGDASYALYLSHTFTINAVVLTLGEIGNDRTTMVIAVAVAILAAVAIHRGIERPIVGALRRRLAP